MRGRELAVRPERKLAGNDDERSRLHRADIIGDRGGGLGQDDPEGGETVGDGHGADSGFGERAISRDGVGGGGDVLRKVSRR